MSEEISIEDKKKLASSLEERLVLERNLFGQLTIFGKQVLPTFKKIKSGDWENLSLSEIEQSQKKLYQMLVTVKTIDQGKFEDYKRLLRLNAEIAAYELGTTKKSP